MEESHAQDLTQLQSQCYQKLMEAKQLSADARGSAVVRESVGSLRRLLGPSEELRRS